MEGGLRVFIRAIKQFFLFFENYLLPLVRVWWWLPLPFVLFEPALQHWLRWRQLKSFKERDYILLEFKLPEEIKKPMKAMEDVFTALYMIAVQHSPTYPRGKWIEGETPKDPTFSLELVGIEGRAHFYIRIEKHLRNSVESIFHAQYPDLGIEKVEDYVERVPQDVPNRDWDIWGYDWVLKQTEAIPLKTHKDFETGKEPKEEKRIDPMARLLEAFTRLREGEQVWLQFVLTDAGDDWRERGEEEVDRLVKREGGGEKRKPLLLEALEIILVGAEEEEEKSERKAFLPEMQLTPGEREKVEKMENKMSKPGFNVSVRTVYIGKREVFFKPHAGLPVSFTSSFSRADQWLTPFSPTVTKVKSMIKLFKLDERRLFLRKRQMFRNYKWRVNPFFPEQAGMSALNPEELAALFHFPGRRVAPAGSLERIRAKRGEAPPGLPTEE